VFLQSNIVASLVKFSEVRLTLQLSHIFQFKKTFRNYYLNIVKRERKRERERERERERVHSLDYYYN